MRLVYLTRSSKGVRFIQKKPEDVKKEVNLSKSNLMWYSGQYIDAWFQVGEVEQQAYSGEAEVIGVFDIDKPKHLSSLLKMFEAHLRDHFKGETLPFPGDIPVELGKE